jgi:hypothetical protein
MAYPVPTQEGEDGRIDQMSWFRAMSLCAHCGQAALGSDSLCTHHASGYGDDWATGNRVMCDFVHRGVVSSTPTEGGSYMELLLGRLEEALAE